MSKHTFEAEIMTQTRGNRITPVDLVGHLGIGEVQDACSGQGQVFLVREVL